MGKRVCVMFCLWQMNILALLIWMNILGTCTHSSHLFFLLDFLGVCFLKRQFSPLGKPPHQRSGCQTGTHNLYILVRRVYLITWTVCSVCYCTVSTHTFTLAGNKSRSLIKECLLWVWMWVLRCSRNSQRTWQRNEVLHTKLDYSRTRGPHRSKVIMELLTSFLAHRKKINKYGLRWERSRNIISSMCFVHKFP